MYPPDTAGRGAATLKTSSRHCRRGRDLHLRHPLQLLGLVVVVVVSLAQAQSLLKPFSKTQRQRAQSHKTHPRIRSA